MRVFSAVVGIESGSSHMPGEHSAGDTSPGVKILKSRKGGGHRMRTGHPAEQGGPQALVIYFLPWEGRSHVSLRPPGNHKELWTVESHLPVDKVDLFQESVWKQE